MPAVQQIQVEILQQTIIYLRQYTGSTRVHGNTAGIKSLSI